MKSIINLLFFIFFSTTLLGQATIISNNEAEETEGGKGIIYDKEFSLDLSINTSGWTFGGNFGKIKTYYKTNLWHFSLGEIKHPRETKQTPEQLPPSSVGFNQSPKSYIFGKRNNFYTLHVGYGQKRYFSEKARKRGLAVGMSYSVGPTLGVLKPYYLDIARIDDNGTAAIVSESYSEENKDAFLNPFTIFGSSGFSLGWKEIRPTVGGRAKAGVHFAWGAFDRFVKAADVGIMVDVYYRDVPIMVSEDNSFYFVNLYLTLQFGKRW